MTPSPLSLRALAAGSCLCVALHAQVLAQDLSFEARGSVPNRNLGSSVAPLGDVNGDGFGDLVVGADVTSGNGFYAYPSEACFVLSGLDGAVLYAVEGTTPADRFGASVASLGDLDADGIGDFAAGAPGYTALFGGPEYVSVHSGADGSLLFRVENPIEAGFGHCVDGAGDVDGDGVPDLAVGAPGFDTPNGAASGRVRIYSGAHHGLLLSLDGEAAEDGFGGSIAGGVRLGPSGGMGILVGAPGHDGGGLDGGAAYLFSASTGALLRKWTGAAGEQLGVHVARLQDLDHDQYSEWLLSDLSTPQGRTTRYDGQTGVPINFLVGSFSDSLTDFDGDSVPDVLTYSPSPPTARIYSGNTGGVLTSFAVPDVGEPAVLSSVGDLNQDGYTDIAWATPSDDEFRGVVRTYLGGDGEPGAPACFGDGPQGSCPCPPSALLDVHFESGLPAGWTIDGLWTVTDECTGCGTLSRHLYFGIPGDCNYDQGIVSGVVTSPVFQAPHTGRLIIDFCHAIDAEPGFDPAHFFVDRSQSGQAVFHVGTDMGLEPPFEVPVEAGESVSLTWLFQTIDHLYNDFTGWRIDDVRVSLRENFSAQGEGCMSSTGRGGRLRARGSTSAAADDLELYASQLVPHQSAIFFVGSASASTAAPLGSGLVCTAGQGRRYAGVDTGAAGFASLTTPAADSLGLIQAGGTYTFQMFYRDLAPGAPCGGPANTTNAYVVTYGP